MLSYGIIISILAGLFINIAPVRADTGLVRPDKLNTFVSEINLLNLNCQGFNCKNPYSVIELYRHSAQADFDSLDLKSKNELLQVAYQQAQVWADTILEGDFFADGKTRLDEVQALYKNRDLMGYKITYSERAWDTANCAYDGINDETLKGCDEGRIRESSFVSTDYAQAFYTMSTAARFIRP